MDSVLAALPGHAVLHVDVLMTYVGDRARLGRRLPDQDGSHHTFEPGDYGRAGGEWYCRAPWHHAPDDYGPRMQGNLTNHEVVEHDDGTITVSPSILIHTTWGPVRQPYTWHGFLKAGVWEILPDTSPEPVG